MPNTPVKDDAIAVRVAVLERALDSYPPREWVKDFVLETTRPLIEAVASMERTIESLSEQADSLFVSHSQMLKERATMEQREHDAKIKQFEALAESRSALGLAKRYGPLLAGISTFIGIIAIAIRVADKLLAILIQHYQ